MVHFHISRSALIVNINKYIFAVEGRNGTAEINARTRISLVTVACPVSIIVLPGLYLFRIVSIIQYRDAIFIGTSN